MPCLLSGLFLMCLFSRFLHLSTKGCRQVCPRFSTYFVVFLGLMVIEFPITNKISNISFIVFVFYKISF